MIRKIIKINSSKCNGCGACANACQEGAIGMVNGKAVLLREDYCDGLGNCLPACPTGAITFEEREALSFDEQAVKENLSQTEQKSFSCPGAASFSMKPKASVVNQCEEGGSLSHWPVQMKLVSANAGFLSGADVVIAADCTAYAFADFHRRFIENRVVLIGCPKLDDIDYSKKLTEIFSSQNIKSVTVVRMQVPCCGGIEYAVKNAIALSGKKMTVEVIIISPDGKIISQE